MDLQVSYSTLTLTLNPKPPSPDLLCQWVSSVWSQIPKQQISDSFKQCGISVATNGSEDKEIVCFKEDQPCHSGLSTLQEKTQELLSERLDLEDSEDPNYNENVEDEEEFEGNEVLVEVEDEEGGLGEEELDSNEEEF